MTIMWCWEGLLWCSLIPSPSPVLSLMLSADGASITRDAVGEMVAACDTGGHTQVNIDTLFLQEQFCSVGKFEEWVKRFPNLSSFTR